MVIIQHLPSGPKDLDRDVALTRVEDRPPQARHVSQHGIFMLRKRMCYKAPVASKGVSENRRAVSPYGCSSTV